MLTFLIIASFPAVWGHASYGTSRGCSKDYGSGWGGAMGGVSGSFDKLYFTDSSGREVSSYCPGDSYVLKSFTSLGSYVVQLSADTDAEFSGGLSNTCSSGTFR